MSKKFLNMKNGIEMLKTFIRDREWQSTLSFDMGHSSEIFNCINDTVLFFRENHTTEEVEKKIVEIHQKSLNKIEEAENSNNVYEKYKCIREAYSYYGLIETITEGSIYSEKTAEQLKGLFGDNYLSMLSLIDKKNPSELTNFKHNDVDVSIDYNNEVIKKYLMLKKWQDKQNLYHENVLYPVFSEYRDEFEKFFDESFVEIEDIGAREKLILFMLSKEKIIDIEDVASYILCGLEEELAYVIGGKAYGLAVLYSKGYKIPNTHVIPINAKLTENDIWFDESKKYAIRSSADVEDNKENSFAGQFDSFLNIPASDIFDYYNKVLNSVNNDRLKAYIEKFQLKKPNMAVIVQEFREPNISGVWIGKSQDEGILEWTLGTGDKLVSGRIKPETEIWNKNSNISNYLKIDNEFIGNILISYQQQIGNVCDFEWCIVNNELYMLQYRPVTKIIMNAIEDAIESNDIIGVPASPGIATGAGIYIEDIEDKSNWEKGGILITECTDPDWTSIMIDAKGIITAQGGLLCHAAIIARELGIPCVTGIGEAIDSLKDNCQVEVDGDRGKVKKKTSN